ncbi:MAG: hypothetical protein JWQ33_1913 [Ramlibacter sp.]|nr:hypothetical protein [Ramlibacter sp.]
MTPAERLARSRLAIVEHLQRREHRHDHRSAEADAASEEADAAGGQGDARQSRQSRRGGGWFAGVSGAARSWWRHHPAQLAFELVTPGLQSYARRKPFQVLGISAAVGAALVITRPWRLISLTTVLIAVVKSSQLTGAVMSALTDVHDWQPAPPQGTRRQG